MSSVSVDETTSEVGVYNKHVMNYSWSDTPPFQKPVYPVISTKYICKNNDVGWYLKILINNFFFSLWYPGNNMLLVLFFVFKDFFLV